LEAGGGREHRAAAAAGRDRADLATELVADLVARRGIEVVHAAGVDVHPPEPLAGGVPAWALAQRRARVDEQLRGRRHPIATFGTGRSGTAPSSTTSSSTVSSPTSG